MSTEDSTKTDDTAKPPEQRYDAVAADAQLFPQPAPAITIGGRAIPVKPLNAYGVMTVFTLVRDIVKPAFNAYRAYRKERDAYIAAAANEDPNAQMPFPFFWIDLLADQKNLDAVLMAVTHILQRGDASVTFEFVKEHLNPLVDLQDLLPMISQANGLGALLKKLLASELMATFTQTLATKTISSTSSPTPSE